LDDNAVLEALKQFLIKNVASKIKLEKPPQDENIENAYELVNPAVYIGWIPPKNHLNEYGYAVPGLLIMSDGGEDLTEEANLNIRIGIATYDPGETTNLEVTPNALGYRDLLNIINIIRIELAKSSTIEGKTSIQGPIKWGMYEEQSYPYWNGWMTFQASIIPITYRDMNTEKFL
jgi:hypothetical protein